MTTSNHVSPAANECCPIYVGEVCWDDGEAHGRAFAVRLADGSMQYVDQSGAGDIAAEFIVLCEDDVVISDNIAAVTRTTATGAGNVAANAASVTIVNVGAAAGTVLGAAISAGETVTINAYYDPVNRWFRRVPLIAYDATGTTFHITRQA